MLTETPDADFSAQAIPFTLPDLGGELVSLADVLGPNGVVVAFICNHCPYVIAIIDRLVEDASELRGVGVNMVAIMSNDYENYPEDGPEKMRAFAAKHGMTFPYLLDQTQEVAQAYGAVCTPDFFGYSAAGVLQYRGRIDNIGVKGSGQRVPELVNAMKVIAKQKEVPKIQSPSIGCSIKWR
ncbi:MAG: peroxiredoxin [Planctomycetota bacterium]|jgi:peroxiredoxin